MQELIAVESRPAVLDVNFQEMKAHLQRELKKYDVVVTHDTVGDAKKLATELNQTANVIDQRRKDEVAQVSEPIRAFDANMRELVTLCKDGRQKILDQVKRFEDEARRRVSDLLHVHRDRLWAEYKVQPEFRNANYDDLVLLTSMTAKGNLAKSAADKLEAYVRDDKEVQDRTGMRLLELENRSYKAGLSAPLTRDHVHRFLQADDETYERELLRILDAEILREEQAQQRMREQIEREQRQQEEAARKAAEEAEHRRRYEQEGAERRAKGECDGYHAGPACADPKCWSRDDEQTAAATPGQMAAVPTRADLTGGKKSGESFATRIKPDNQTIGITVMCTFALDAPRQLPNSAIEAELRRVLAKAGISTLTSVQIYRNVGA